MTIQWEKVHVFISSTFNDMHAERDYLVKQVFPELREWCEKRKLNLVDIDLRWGVTEQDALHNKSVVKVCLDRIDDCRPFFLCFLGQRRGWVPSEGDISAATFEEFPALKEYAGNASVTEMEILHALVDPLHRGKVSDPKKSAESYEPARYAFFYLRNDSYLKQLPNDPLLLRQTYTNEGVENKEERAQQDAQLKQWREEKIPATGRPTRHYKAEWNTHLTTPELLLPLQCPSSEPTSLKRWQEQWAKAGVTVTGDDIEKDPVQAEKARTFNNKLVTGRLAEFQSKDQPLSHVILHDLQEALATRFPDHIEIGEQGDLQKEMDQQEQFLYTGSEGFISRGDDFKELDSYVDGDEKRLFVLTAPGGIGKSTLLANWIDHYRVNTESKPGQSIHFRFIGQSDRSTTVYSLLHFLMQELKESTRKLTIDIPDDPQELCQELPKLLEDIGKKGKTVIVLDALNQLESGLSELAWLPIQLPDNIKLVVSFKRGEPAAEEMLERMRGQAVLGEVKPFADLNDRRKLVKAYLGQYLKDLDERHLETLIISEGAANPLFLKVVLSELRVFGAFSNLGEKIRSDFGETPITAFQGVLKRLENDPAYSPVDPQQAVPLLFGLLAHARQGLSVEELTGLFVTEFGKTQQEARDTVQLYLRQVRLFLAHRDTRYDFFYESFKLAAKSYYTGKKVPQRPTEVWHHRLADYFAGQPIQLKINDGTGPNIHKLVEQPYQQLFGRMPDELIKTLLDYFFLDAKIIALGVQSLLEDFQRVFSTDLLHGSASADQNALGLVYRTILLSVHVLSNDRSQLSSQLYGRLLNINEPHIKGLLEEAAGKKAPPWLRPLKASLTRPGSATKQIFSGHTESVYTVAIAPDGVNIVSGSLDETIKIWDFVSGKLIRTLNVMTSVNSLLITPDAKNIISAGGDYSSDDNSIKVWDLESGLLLYELNGHTSKVNSLAITSDGSMLVSGSYDNNIIIWDLKNKVLRQILKGHTGNVRAVAITPDGEKIISGSNDGTVRVWKLTRGGEGHILASYQKPPQPQQPAAAYPFRPSFLSSQGIRPMEKNPSIGISVNALAVLPDGKRVIAGLEDKRMNILDINNGENLGTLSGHNLGVDTLAVSKDGKQVVSGSPDRTIMIWDLQNTKKVKTLKGHTNWVESVAFAPDGQSIVSGSADATVRVWGLEDSSAGQTQEDVEESAFVRNNITAIAISRDGRFAASGTEMGTAGVWDVQKGERLKILGKQSQNAIYGIALTLDGKSMISTKKWAMTENTDISMWNLENDDIIFTKPIIGWEGGPLAITPDCQWVLTANNRMLMAHIYIHHIENSDINSTPVYITGHVDEIEAVAVTPDGRYAFIGGKDNFLTLWDLKENLSVHKYSGFTGTIWAVAINENGQLGASVSDDVITIWDLVNEKIIYSIKELSHLIRSIAMTTNGQYFITGTKENCIKIWDMKSGQKITQFNMDGGLQSFAVSSDGAYIVAGEAGGAVHFLKLEGVSSSNGIISSG